ncbi:MAG TPA: hypothetical protein PL082_09935, partial [Tepidiformaceae bacterium]|nr:hypothetical protein [Tepidiformaceae bacterium]
QARTVAGLIQLPGAGGQGGGGGGFGGGGGGTAQPGDYLVIVRVGGTMSKQTLRVERKAGMAGGSPFGFEVIEDKEGGERRP